jgi:hypothetical protein
MSERIIDVGGHACTIHVYRFAKRIWIAVGEYLGEQLRTRGENAEQAAMAWRRAAEFKHT